MARGEPESRSQGTLKIAVAAVTVTTFYKWQCVIHLFNDLHQTSAHIKMDSVEDGLLRSAQQHLQLVRRGAYLSLEDIFLVYVSWTWH